MGAARPRGVHVSSDTAAAVAGAPGAATTGNETSADITPSTYTYVVDAAYRPTLPQDQLPPLWTSIDV